MTDKSARVRDNCLPDRDILWIDRPTCTRCRARVDPERLLRLVADALHADSVSDHVRAGSRGITQLDDEGVAGQRDRAEILPMDAVLHEAGWHDLLIDLQCPQSDCAVEH